MGVRRGRDMGGSRGVVLARKRKDLFYMAAAAAATPTADYGS